MHPWETAQGAGFQLIQSFIALGAGGGWGVGLGEGRQKMFYLPQAHTDFIFAVVGEEFGILGGVVVVALFGIILFRGMRIAQEEPDPFASLLAVGLTASLSFQAFINMAVVIGMIPTKGLPLPFLSYGGTAIDDVDGGARRAARTRSPSRGQIEQFDESDHRRRRNRRPSVPRRRARRGADARATRH